MEARPVPRTEFAPAGPRVLRLQHVRLAKHRNERSFRQAKVTESEPLAMRNDRFSRPAKLNAMSQTVSPSPRFNRTGSS